MSVPIDVAALRSVRRGTASADEFARLAACRDEGVAIGLDGQLAVLDELIADGEKLGGWKVGCASRSARDAMGAGVRPCGYVLASRVMLSGSRLGSSDAAGVRIEPEICLTLGADLAGADVTREQARRAVAMVRPAFELAERRL